MNYLTITRLLALILLSFTYGITVSHFKLPPYYLVMDGYRSVKVTISQMRKVESKYILQKQNFMNRTISTTLLPIKVRSITLNSFFKMPAYSGGITTVKNTIIISDRRGNFYFIKNNQNKPEKANFPEFPNNYKLFIKFGYTLNKNYFRVHDIVYIRNKNEHYILASHEFFDPDLKLPRFAVSRLKFDPISMKPIGDWKTIFSSSPNKTKYYSGIGGGGRMVVKNSTTVYLTIGNYVLYGPGSFATQDKTNVFGSIGELNILTGQYSILSIGHKNPQGLLLTKSGQLLSSEHGPKGGSELNIIKAGKNYGWPLVTLGTDYGAYSWPNSKTQGRHPGFERPLFSWLPSIAISNLIEISRVRTC